MQASKLNKKTTAPQSASDIAKQLGVHKTTVNRIAAKQKIGVLVGQQRIFTTKDAKKIERFCRFSVGNPNFGKKN